ncbi:MAG: amino acid permease [Chitinophagia bacterium]|jgi:amino acid transporter|nr:amino acid permease [Chitinophagia bacterium]
MSNNVPHLERKLSLLHATAINMIDMVGIGPFVVLSVVAQIMAGPYFLYAWIAGALLSYLDAMVWSQLGAALPRAGGSFHFLKEGYGKKGGPLMSFLFVWQTMIQAPLVIASASIGFSQYASYFFHFSMIEEKIVSGSVVILVITLLYRKIESIGKISVFLWVGVLFTMGWIILGGVAHGNFLDPIKHINDGFTMQHGFVAALGFASVKTIYSYLGYYNVCHLGGEIKNPSKNIPRSMFISITGIAILYLCMNISVASVLPFEVITQSKYVVSEYIKTLYGEKAGAIVTVLILMVAFASLFSATLGYSRIPYAAAQNKSFFNFFNKVHPTLHFPHRSLLVLGGIAFVFSLLFRLKEVIDAILAMRIMIQFIGQAVGLLLLMKRKGKSFFPWRMPLYPIPLILAILIWGGIFFSTGQKMMMSGITVTALGLIAFFVAKKMNWIGDQEIK